MIAVSSVGSYEDSKNTKRPWFLKDVLFINYLVKVSALIAEETGVQRPLFFTTKYSA
jgi:hypothetical protein